MAAPLPLPLVSLAPSLLPFFVWHMFHCGTPWNFTRLFAKITKCAGWCPLCFVCISCGLTPWRFLFLPSIPNCFHCHPAVCRCFFVQFVYPSVYSSRALPTDFLHMQKSVAYSLGKHTHTHSLTPELVR